MDVLPWDLFTHRHVHIYVHIQSRGLLEHGNVDDVRERDQPKFRFRDAPNPVESPSVVGTAMTTPGLTRVWDRLYVGRLIHCDYSLARRVVNIGNPNLTVVVPPSHNRLTIVSQSSHNRLTIVSPPWH